MDRTLNDIMNEIMAKLPELTTREVILIANAIEPLDPTIAAMSDGDVLLKLGIFE